MTDHLRLIIWADAGVVTAFSRPPYPSLQIILDRLVSRRVQPEETSQITVDCIKLHGRMHFWICTIDLIFAPNPSPTTYTV